MTLLRVSLDAPTDERLAWLNEEFFEKKVDLVRRTVKAFQDSSDNVLTCYALVMGAGSGSACEIYTEYVDDQLNGYSGKAQQLLSTRSLMGPTQERIMSNTYFFADCYRLFTYGLITNFEDHPLEVIRHGLIPPRRRDKRFSAL